MPVAPTIRSRTCRLGLALLTLMLVAMGSPSPVRADPAFRQWLEALWPEAQAQGVARATFDRAFQGVVPDLALPDLAIPGDPSKPRKGQAEFTRTPAEYLGEANLARLAQQGRALLARHAQALAAIEQQSGVDRHMLLALWGRETAFGGFKLPHYAIRVLATQAYLGRRKEMFRAELLFALKMLQDGVVTPEAMRSSWAGAMGLTQFLPSEFYQYAVDADGDGRADLFASVPDALASAARQLVAKGWQAGRTWGYEVRVPDVLDCTLEGPDRERPIREWQRMGFSRAFGLAWRADRTEDRAYLLLPAGTYGPAFLATENFKVLRAYNTSDLYALFVGNLADRIAGGGLYEGTWDPIRMLSTAEIEELQTHLAAQGFDIGARVDGKIGTRTRVAVGLYQKKAGLAADCWPAAPVLGHVRAGAKARQAGADGKPPGGAQ